MHSVATPLGSAGATPEDDWAFCRESLKAVSRTFSRPIEMLSGRLRVSVACSYLLCRILDTVEDAQDLPLGQRARLYEVFLEALHARQPADEWRELLAPLRGTDAELRLARNLDRVLRVLATLPPEMQRISWHWTSEMCRGMALYSHRPAGPDGIRALFDENDLYRYCYYVAGTVGHMLTELFLLEHAADFDAPRQRTLLRHAESFGLGLQLVNILKDVAADSARGWSFIPRRVEGVSLLPLLRDPSRRGEAHHGIAPLFARAYECLDEALVYSLAVPPHLLEVRYFLLIPLWLALQTLKLTSGNDSVFEPGQRVAITRAEVETQIRACVELGHDDQALRRMYAELRGPAGPREGPQG